MMKFFSYDPDDGFQLHATEGEAKTRAQNAIDLYRDNAAKGWAEGVEGVCWGNVRQLVVEINIAPKNNYDDPCDYNLADA
jgi:hypothetical protein